MGVTMPEQDQDWDAGSTARVSGWGTLSSGGSSPDTLQAVNVPVVSDADCAVISLIILWSECMA